MLSVKPYVWKPRWIEDTLSGGKHVFWATPPPPLCHVLPFLTVLSPLFHGTGSTWLQSQGDLDDEHGWFRNQNWKNKEREKQKIVLQLSKYGTHFVSWHDRILDILYHINAYKCIFCCVIFCALCVITDYLMGTQKIILLYVSLRIPDNSHKKCWSLRAWINESLQYHLHAVEHKSYL